MRAWWWALVLGCLAGPVLAQRGYEHSLVGDPADNVSTRAPTAATAMLMGGGPDVDDAFRWMIAQAGGGDFVVLRASGDDGYNRYVYALGGMASVETLVVRSRAAAADPLVLARVAQAEAVFITGGDQADYLRLWKGTPLQAALEALVARRVPIGGTSAGLAVLGEVDYAATKGSVVSAEALADPYRRTMTLDQGFLTAPGLAGVVTDSHFRQRDRMGRLLAFVARNVQDGRVALAAARGLGVDERTAVVVADGVARRLGVGAAYFLRPLAAPLVCQRGQPLTQRDVQVDRLDGDGSFDLRSWTGATTRYGLAAEAGQLLSSQPGGAVY
ncbi:MAG: cyanophycinase [Inhella sp.]|uniref:cyanophycinase n=1 Tax=Inhella sp. TaxID=1921806 RepID=UPI00391F4161